MKRAGQHKVLCSGLLLLSLLGSGCESYHPELIDFITGSGSAPLVDRDSTLDHTEWVGGLCCNDIYPQPLGIDTTVQARIIPADDLDFFQITVMASNAGILTLHTGLEEGLTFRLLKPDLDELTFLMDTIVSTEGEKSPWTVVYGEDKVYYALVQGDGDREDMAYDLRWERFVPNTLLSFIAPTAGEDLQRGQEYDVKWAWAGMGPTSPNVSVVLLRGALVIRHLRLNFLSTAQTLRWIPAEDLTPAGDYRLVLYVTDQPRIMDISDAFNIL